jgi:hypothetical protein
VSQDIRQETQDLKDFLTDQQLDDARARLASIYDFIVERNKALEGAGGNDELALTIIAETLGHLDPLLQVGDQFVISLERVRQFQPQGNNGYLRGLAAVELYSNLLMAYICALKYRCEKRNRAVILINNLAGTDEAWAAKLHDAVEQLYADLALFWARIEFWTTDEKVASLTQWQADLKAFRPTLITVVQTRGQDRDHSTVGAPAYEVAVDFFNDGDKEIGIPHEAVAHTEESGGYFGRGARVPVTWVTFVSHHDDVERQRVTYIEAQKKQAEIDLSFVDPLIERIRKQAKEICGLIPPNAPAPVVEWTQTSWASAAWKWPAGSEVRYGVAYGNGTKLNACEMSAWSPTPADGKSCPKVALPVDDTGAANLRYITRELRKTPTDPVSKKQFIVADNTSTVFIDLDPAEPSKVCRAPQAPPTVVEWTRSYKVPAESDADAPSWPHGYRVRYRYGYTNAAGASPYRSGWSSAKDGSADRDGYASGEGGKGSRYLAKLTIPWYPDVQGCKVYRQFKGQPETECKGQLEKQKNQFVFTDAGL